MHRLNRRFTSTVTLYPAQTCSEPLPSIISCLVTFVTHFLNDSPYNLSYTDQPNVPIAFIKWNQPTSQNWLNSEGINNSVHSRLSRVAKESQGFVLDFLKDLQASILLIPFASTSEGPQEPLVLNAASRTISPFFLLV